MQNIVGTYAFMSTGSSTIVTGAAPIPPHWSALYAPISIVGKFTVYPNGTAKGLYWAIVGTVNFGLTGIDLDATITLNDDCTGTIQYPAGPNQTVQKEDFFVLDNGREIRSVAVQTNVPTGTWVTTAHRINGSCGQHKVHGLYLFDCNSELLALPVPPPNIFAGAFLIRMLVSPGGEYTGTMIGKVGPINTEPGLPVSGNLTVHDDCTAEGTLASPAQPSINLAKGVFFDEGRQGYWLPLVNKFPDDSTSSQLYSYCSITLMDRR